MQGIRQGKGEISETAISSHGCYRLYGKEIRHKKGDERVKELFGRYRRNRRELDLIADQIDRLNERLEDVPEVAGKVTKSSKDFPYIEEHMTVRMKEPKEATLIKDKLRKKEKRQKQLSQEITKVENFIDSLPEGMEKQIMEMVYLEGMSQTDAAEMLGYTQSMVSKIIKRAIKDS